MGVQVEDRFHFDSGAGVRRGMEEVLGLSRLIEEGNFDLVHVHGSWDHTLAGTALRRGPRRFRLVRSDHGGRLYKGTPHERLQFGPRGTDHLIVLSDRLRARALIRLGQPPDAVTMVRGAIDLEEYQPRTAPPHMRASLGLGEKDVVFAVVARVQRHRRFPALLAAAKFVQRADARVKIVVLGRGTRKATLLDRPVVERGLERTVLPLGYRREDYHEVLAACDAGLMLVPGSDGSCRAAMQMAAMEKPLVVARRGVLPDIVCDGETGIVTPDTPEELAKALLEMASLSAEVRRAWGRAARERMAGCFSLCRHVDDVVAVYEKVLAGPVRRIQAGQTSSTGERY
jgi:glycosyltransferase involved in cell wall biosynthesis